MKVWQQHSVGPYQIVELFERFRFLFQGPFHELTVPGWLDINGTFRPWIIKAFEKRLIDHFGKNEPLSILSFGLGAGMVANLQEHWQVDFVEKDELIIQIANEHFSLPKSSRVINSSAETFLSGNWKTKYDVVFYDLFCGKKMCSHLLTRKSLSKLRGLVKARGILCFDITDNPQELYWFTKLLHEKHDVTIRHDVFPANRLRQNILVTEIKALCDKGHH